MPVVDNSNTTDPAEDPASPVRYLEETEGDGSKASLAWTHVSHRSTPTPSEVDEASDYTPMPFVQHESDNDDTYDADDNPEQLLLPAPSTYTGARGRNRSGSFISLQSINDTLNKIKREIADKYNRYNYILRRRNRNVRANEIYYSVFKPVPGITLYTPTHGDAGDSEFISAVAEANHNLIKFPPQRISAGSSGSYFIYNSGGFPIGVFKPKDEEPYGPLSPKWTKWLHRNLFPCFFGRSCLIPNNGYISEAAASLLDYQLQTHLVPGTDTVELASSSFYYSMWGKKNYPKIGSFQIFLHGYTQADEFLYKYPLPGSPVSRRIVYTDEDQPFEWDEATLQQFREELEKLVILDYIMRNTDRGLDNWMIKVEYDSNGEPHVRIGAIDSGLAFPWKHPDEWRSYPFGWLFLPAQLIGQPFSQRTRDHFLPLLLSTEWWQETAVVMKQLFMRDSEFKERMWKKQWAVLKGQAFNVVETLKTQDQGPLELARRQRVMVWDDEMEVPVRVPQPAIETAMNEPLVETLSSFPALENQPRAKDVSSPSSTSSRRGSDQVEQQYRQLEGLNQQHNRGTHINRASMWDELLQNTQESNSSPIADHRELATIPNSNDVGFSVAEDAAAEGTATKLVIVERLQTVYSKPPVFTWC